MSESTTIDGLFNLLREVDSEPASTDARLDALLGIEDANPFGIEAGGVVRKKKHPRHVVLRRLKERLKDHVRGKLGDHIRPINAETVRDFIPGPDEQTFFLMNGNCEYADYLLAFKRELDTRGEAVTSMLCSTLSLNEHSIDVLDHFPCTKHVLVSSYFLATDKANTLLKMREEGRLDAYRIGFFRNHTKITLLATDAGNRFVFCGSANLRSSATIEQFTIDNCAETYDFVWRWLVPLIERFSFEGEATAWESTPRDFYPALDRLAARPLESEATP